MSGNVNITGTKGQLDATIAQVDQSVDKTQHKVEATQLKLMTLWSYGNQIATMMLRLMSDAAKGTEAQATIQKIIAGLQFAQAEVAFAMTEKQALAAFASQQWIQGAILQALAISMQVNIIRAQINKAAAEVAEQEAQQLRAQIEAYRS